MTCKRGATVLWIRPTGFSSVHVFLFNLKLETCTNICLLLCLYSPYHFFFLSVFLHGGAYSHFSFPLPCTLFFLYFSAFPLCFFAALFLYYCSRMSGNPADPNVPCLQLFKQHYVFWWQVCQSSALQSSRWVPEYLQNWRLLSMQILYCIITVVAREIKQCIIRCLTGHS